FGIKRVDQSRRRHAAAGCANDADVVLVAADALGDRQLGTVAQKLGSRPLQHGGSIGLMEPNLVRKVRTNQVICSQFANFWFALLSQPALGGFSWRLGRPRGRSQLNGNILRGLSEVTEQ